ncbi:MAG: hypothetical protein Q9M20_03775 [Mariprofundaceae bacterium]|nr:hypothetical protein [Mariprofundaceae bacterium]
MKTTRLNDFYLLCDGAHREFYSVLLNDWQEIGLPWSCDEKMLHLSIHSVMKDTVFVCFSLHIGGLEMPSIRMDMQQWHNHLGQENTARFMRSITLLQGLKHQQRGDVFFIDSPGHALPPVQKELRNMIHQFAVQLPNKIPL